MSNECRKSYHPNDTDFPAAVVREKFCGCFASGMVDAATNNSEFANDLMAYSAGRRKLSNGVAKIVNQLTDYCSQRL
jgi:hypothetical protein